MCRRPPSFAGAVFVRGRCFRSRALFSFVGGHLRWWVVVFAFVRGRSPSFVGGRAVGVVVPFVWCRGGRLVRLWVIVIAGGRAVGGVQCWGVGGKLVCGGGVW